MIKTWNVHRTHLLILLALSLASIARGQNFGVHSDWSWDQTTGYVYVHAQTWADYSFSYYYNLYAQTQVYTGSAWVCTQGNWGTPTANVTCSTYVATGCAGPPSLTLTTFHEVAPTYYLPGHGYSDAYGVSLIRQSPYSASTQSWPSPGYAQYIGSPVAFSTGTQQNQGSTCFSRPTEETSYYNSWGTQGYTLAGVFAMSLAGKQNYYNMLVQESFSNFTDLCYLPGSPYSPLSSPIPSPPWTVSANQYAYDNIGMRNDQAGWIRYYQEAERTCGWNVLQSMSIYMDNQWQTYQSHWSAFQLTGYPNNPSANRVGAYRDTASGWIYWQ